MHTAFTLDLEYALYKSWNREMVVLQAVEDIIETGMQAHGKCDKLSFFDITNTYYTAMCTYEVRHSTYIHHRLYMEYEAKRGIKGSEQPAKHDHTEQVVPVAGT